MQIAEAVHLMYANLDNTFLHSVYAMIAKITQFQIQQTNLEINVSDQNAQKPLSSPEMVYANHVHQAKTQIKANYTVSMSHVILDQKLLL